MFKMRFAQLFDTYLPSSGIPGFERVKNKSETPEFNYKLSEFTTAQLEGIPIHFKGWTPLTAVYTVTLYCDVCELPVHETTIPGTTREIHLDKYEQMENNENFKQELEKGDKAVFKEMEKHVELKALYKPQCSRCGRWVAKGKMHEQCFNYNYGLCKYCGNVMQKLLGDKQ